MSSGPSNLYDLAEALLRAAAGVFVDNGEPAPALQYVYAAGQPAAVCDQLVVSWEMISPGTAGGTLNVNPMPAQSYGMVMPRNARLQLWCFRCLTDVVGGSGLQLVDLSPSVEQVSYDSKRIMTDAYILTRGIVAAHYAGTFKTFSDGMAMSPTVPVAANGGIGGCVISVDAELA